MAVMNSHSLLGNALAVIALAILLAYEAAWYGWYVTLTQVLPAVVLGWYANDLIEAIAKRLRR